MRTKKVTWTRWAMAFGPDGDEMLVIGSEHMTAKAARQWPKRNPSLRNARVFRVRLTADAQDASPTPQEEKP
jgi:hypothetical protein